MDLWLRLAVFIVLAGFGCRRNIAAPAAKLKEQPTVEPSDTIPAPPKWKSKDWVCAADKVEGKHLWTARSKDLQLCIFDTKNDNGACLAAFRQVKKGSGGANQLGIFCYSKSGNVKFYDWSGGENEDPVGQEIPAATADGGCTGCHFGENPIIGSPKLPALQNVLKPLGNKPEPPRDGTWFMLIDNIDSDTNYPSCAGCHEKLGDPTSAAACRIYLPALAGDKPYMPPKGPNDDSRKIIKGCCEKYQKNVRLLKDDYLWAYDTFCK